MSLDHAEAIEADLARRRTSTPAPEQHATARPDVLPTCPRCPAPLSGDKCRQCGWCAGCEGGCEL